MGTSKLMNKLEEYFNLSKSKQKKKRDKLLKIIHKLEEKKSGLEQLILSEREIDDTSEKFDELSKELTVISRLIDKAKKKSLSD